jgi:predicted permease
MNWVTQLFSRRRQYDDLSDEINAHLEEKVESLVASGMSRVDAAATARRQFGNVTAIGESSREVWQWPTIDSFVMDVRYALRQLRRNPAVASAAILTLAIGIAANATVFSWTRAVLLDALPGAADPARVVAIEGVTPSSEWTPTSYPDFRDLRDQLRTVESMTVSFPVGLALGNDGAIERRWGELVSGNFFDVLRIQPQRGRFFSTAERGDAAGSPAVVVISHALWTSRYQSNPAIIGSAVRINRYPFTIIGVAPRGFHGSMPGNERELWVPATMISHLDPNGGSFLKDRKTRMFRVLARLAAAVTIEQARAELASTVSRLADVHPNTNRGMSAAMLPVSLSHYGFHDRLRGPLGMLTGACAVVLLIVCANMANLLLARAMNRRREMSLRLALGAPRARLVRQLVTESAVLTMAGAVLGLLVAMWLSGSLRWFVPDLAAPTLLRPHLDAGVLAFTAGLACAVTILAGIAPAWYVAREQLGDALGEGSRGTTGGARTGRLRGLLVASEMALTVVALVGAGLFMKSFFLARAVQPGFDSRGIAIGAVSLSAAGYDGPQGDAFMRAVRERLERQPGVTAVSYTDYVPLTVGAGSWEDLQIEGYAPDPSENMKIYRAVVAPGYFDVLKVPMREGRDFTIQDDDAHAPVMIVNEEFVRRFLHGGSVIGRKVEGWGKPFTIIGVVPDVKTYRLTERPTPYFYVPMRQIYRPEFPFTFLVRTSGSVEEAVTAIRREVESLEPAMPVFNAISLAEFTAAPLYEQKTAASLLTILASVALFLAAIGLYGVMAYSVAQRTKEIGIRFAMGAQRRDVLQLLARNAAALMLTGLAIGLTSAAALSRVVASMLFGVSPGDWAVYATASACIVMIAIVATGVPARRAMRVDPMVALRVE